MRARALLYYPLRAGEPFGLVMVEAMASGTPVIALNRGAVPEIIDHGITGWIAQDAEELVPAVEAAARLDPDAIAAIVRDRFSHHRMVDGIESILTTLHKGA